MVMANPSDLGHGKNNNKKNYRKLSKNQKTAKMIQKYKNLKKSLFPKKIEFIKDIFLAKQILFVSQY